MELARKNVILLHVSCFLLSSILMADRVSCIRLPDRTLGGGGMKDTYTSNQPLKTAVFSLGSFWRSEAVFGCLEGVVRTTVGYAGGSKSNPEYRSLGHHAESVQIYDVSPVGRHSLLSSYNLGLVIVSVTRLFHRYLSLQLEPKGPGAIFFIEYDPRVINFRQLLEVFWASHDSRQVFGQGPDVGDQYRSIIFTNGTEESRAAAISKEREQSISKGTVVTTQIQQFEIFYPAEPEHQKFELKRNPFLLQLIGNLPQEELEKSSLAAKINGYAAELCPPKIQRQIDAKINEIIRKGWPILREV